MASSACGRAPVHRVRAEVVGPPLKPGSFGTVHVQFVPDGPAPDRRQVFELDLVELDAKGRAAVGQRLLLKTGRAPAKPCCRREAEASDGVSWTPDSTCRCGCWVCRPGRPAGEVQAARASPGAGPFAWPLEPSNAGGRAQRSIPRQPSFGPSGRHDPSSSFPIRPPRPAIFTCRNHRS